MRSYKKEWIIVWMLLLTLFIPGFILAIWVVIELRKVGITL